MTEVIKNKSTDNRTPDIRGNYKPQGAVVISSFQSILDNIDKHIQSLEWKTDTGHVLHGVLHRDGSRVLLNINSKELSQRIEFNYIYHEGNLGSRRLLYPFDFRGSKSIPPTSLSNSWPIEVSMLIDEQKIPEVAPGTQVSYTYDSFLWSKVPESETEQSEHYLLMERLKNFKTSLGSVTISLDIYERHATHPAKLEKRMDTISITIESDKALSDKEIRMWHIRFSQLLAFIHKERVVLRAIHRGFDNILVPSFVEEYEEANYAYREPIGVSDFVEIIEKILPKFVDNYEETANLLEDLVQYYHDYPLDPPDNIQLLRLFSGLEQCVNHYWSNNPQPKKALSAEEETRRKEFDGLLDVITSNSSVTPGLKKYLKGKPKRYYITPDNPASAKSRIATFGEFIVNEFNIFSYLRGEDNADIIWKMRNTVAHGFYDGEIKKEFYKRRDDFGQAIEQSIRLYILHLLGVDRDSAVKHKEPLKARVFNGL